MARTSANGRPSTSRRALAGISAGRALSLLAFLPLASRFPTYARLVTALVVDERMPPARKALLAGAAGYLVLGRDLIPDDVPIIGGLDDLIIVVLAVDLFLEGVPEDLLAEKLADLGIPRGEYEQDMAQIRRLTPAPLRRTIRRVPALVGQAGTTIERSGILPRLRRWIDKEEPIA